ncbi:hypothetical protein ACPPVV_16595 [Rhodanobacter sp. Col0626]|uniref:hypothetical protein n=1 Tax=Rhodanobacter sp. Col0626 TaxID=3415679 RepID=UPI003CF48DC2
MKKLLLPLVFGFVLTGCHFMDTMTDGLRHTAEVADDLKASVGSKPFVGFNWNNGTLTQVTVQFQGVPAGKTTDEIAALSRHSIQAHFKEQPRHIIISFSLPGQG